MNALTPAAATTRALNPAAPEPGQYWRLTRALPRKHTHRANHRAMETETLLLITQIEVADGAHHSVHLAPHPLWPENESIHLHIDDFLSDWTHVPNADSVRAAEMAALLTDMQATQRAMLEPPPPGLRALVTWLVENEAQSVAVPALGCGLGALDWHVVRERIEYYLRPLADDLVIHVYRPR